MAKLTISTKKNSSSGRELTQNERQEIEKLAYEFFLERNAQHGYDQEDWLKAERIVRSRRS